MRPDTLKVTGEKDGYTLLLVGKEKNFLTRAQAVEATTDIHETKTFLCNKGNSPAVKTQSREGASL